MSGEVPGGYSVNVSGDARVGIIGDYGTIENFTVEHLTTVTPRRAVVWPVIVGSPPPVASAFVRRAIGGAAEGGGAAEVAGTAEGASHVVLSGDGGTGKTQLAARRFARSAADVRIWASGRTRDSIVTALAEAAVRLDLADAPEGADHLGRLALGFLAGSTRSWMLVVDDLADPALLDELWPAGSGTLIVTTRRRDAALSGGSRTVARVDVFSADEARSYLESRLGPAAAGLPADALAEADALADDLGRLPLALSQAAAVIIDQALSCRDYRGWFADRSATLDELFPPTADADGYRTPLAATWSLALEAADRIAPVGAAGPLARLVAVFDAAGAPDTLFTGPVACEWLSAQSGTTVDPRDARTALRTLDRLALITHDVRQGPRAVRMHGLTARAITQGAAAAPAAPAGAPTMTGDAAAAAGATGAAASSAAATGAAASSAAATGHRAAAAGATGHPPAAVGATGHPAAAAGDPATSRLAEVVAVATRALQQFWPEIEREPGLGESLRANVVALRRADDQALWDAVDSAGEQSGHLLLMRFGNSLAQAGLTAESRTYFAALSAESQQRLGPMNVLTVAARRQHAHSIWEVGDPAAALPLFESLLSDTAAAYGADSYPALTARQSLASVCAELGQFDRAIDLHTRVVTGFDRLLGPEHPSSLASLNNLAHAYGLAGDFDRAVPLQRRVAQGFENTVGRDDRHTLTALNNLANGLDASGNVSEALALHTEVLADRRRVLGDDDPDTFVSAHNVAHCLSVLGDWQAAVAIYERNLADRERVLGDDHVHTLLSRSDLARAYQCLAELQGSTPLMQRSISLLQRVVADSSRLLGPNSATTLTAQNDLAYAYAETGDHDRAVALFEQNLAQREQVFGPEHPSTVVSRENLAYARSVAAALSGEWMPGGTLPDGPAEPADAATAEDAPGRKA